FPSTTLFRSYGIVYLIKHKYHRGLILNVSLIFAGAMGNIIDSTFYGMIFSESSYFAPAKLFPPEGGYSSLFHGKVVDMFYFPMIDTVWPDWVPLVGGNTFQFFRPVFNVADSSISVGMFILLIFYRDFFSGSIKPKSKGDLEESESEPIPATNE